MDDVQSADEHKRRQLKALCYRVVVIEAAAIEKGLNELADRVRLTNERHGKADRADKGFITVINLTTHTLDGLRCWKFTHGGILQDPTAHVEGLGDMILADLRKTAKTWLFRWTFSTILPDIMLCA